MDETMPKRRIRVYKQQSFGVTLQLLSVPEGDVVAEHAASSWLEVWHWAYKDGVPPELISVDPDAEDELGPN